MFNIILFVLLATPGANSSQLNVVIKNVVVGKGSIVVEIYQSKKTFLKTHVTSKRIKAIANPVKMSFQLANGTYAAVAYQDLNDNHKLDQNMFRIPKEPYGLSNNFHPSFSIPTFDDCKFSVKNAMAIPISLQ